MNHTPDATTAGNGGSFEPQQAAALLDQATQQARRTFASGPPLLWIFRAVLVLVVFGSIWLSVRGRQDPYSAPSGCLRRRIRAGGHQCRLERCGDQARRRRRQRASPAGEAVLARRHAGGLDRRVRVHGAAVPRRRELPGLGAVPGQRSAADHRPARRGHGGSTARLAHGWHQPRRRHRRRGRGVRRAWPCVVDHGHAPCAAMLGAAAFTVWQQRRSVVRP